MRATVVATSTPDLLKEHGNNIFHICLVTASINHSSKYVKNTLELQTKYQNLMEIEFYFGYIMKYSFKKMFMIHLKNAANRKYLAISD